MTNVRGAEGFIAISPGNSARNSGWTAPAPPPSPSHTNAFKVNEDVVIPLPRMGDYCDGIERINIELSTAEQAGPVRCTDRIPSRAICPWSTAPTPSWTSDVLIERPPRATPWSYISERARVAGSGCWTTWTCPWPRPSSASPNSAWWLAELTNRAANPTPLPPPAGLLRARLLEEGAEGAAWTTSSTAPPVRPLSEKMASSRCRRKCCAAASSWPCTCTPATATCTPTSR